MDEAIEQLREEVYALIAGTKRPKRVVTGMLDGNDASVLKKAFKGSPQSVRADMLDAVVEERITSNLTPEAFVYYFPSYLFRILEFIEQRDKRTASEYSFYFEQWVFENWGSHHPTNAQREVAKKIWALGVERLPGIFRDRSD
jgi:hypothetical protein